MKIKALNIAIATVIWANADLLAATDTANVPWVPLFNGRDFTGWDFNIQYSTAPSGPHLTSTPLVTITDGMVHCLADPAPLDGGGGMITLKEYSQFALRMDYKWGTRGNGKWLSGIFVRVPNDDRTIWPTHFQYEIMKGYTGTSIAWQGMQANITENNFNGGKDELPDWNAIGAQVMGGGSGYFLLNGKTVLRWSSLSSSTGRIWIELENNEIIFRNVEIRNYDSTFAPITALKPGQRINAANRDNYVGLMKTEACSDEGGGQMVTSQRSDEWITFYRMDFGASSPSKFIARCSGSGSIHAMIDGPMGIKGSGKEIAVVSAPGSAGFATVQSPVTGATGVHQLYLRLDKGVSLNWFQFGDGVGVAPRRGVVEPAAPLAAGAAYLDRLSGDVVFPLSLEQHGIVQLSIFSTSGRTLHRTAPRQMNAGRGELRLDSRVLNPGDGMVVYTLSAGGHSRCGTVMIQPR